MTILSGRWWLPDRPERAVGGTIDLSESLYELVLTDSLVEVDPAETASYVVPGQETRHAVIHGYVDGRPVSLLNAQGYPLSIPGGVTVSEEWYPAAVLVGDHVGRNAQFSSLRLRFIQIEEWAGAPNVGGGSRDGQLFASTSTERQLCRGTINEGRFDLKATGLLGGGRFSREVSSRVAFNIECESPRELGEITELVAPPRALASLMWGEGIRQTEVQVHVAGQGEDHGGWLELHRPWVEREESNRKPPRGLLTLAELEDPAAVIGTWFDRWSVLGRAVQIFLATEFGTASYIDTTVFTMLQSVEALHEALGFQQHRLPKDEHQKWVETILGRAGDVQYHERLMAALGASNNRSFKERLRELLDHEAVRDYDTKTACQWLTSVRNEISHGGARSFGKDPDDYWRLMGVRWLLRLRLLGEAGISAEALRTGTSRHSAARRALAVWR